MFLVHAPAFVYVVLKLRRLIVERGIKHPQAILFAQINGFFLMKTIASIGAILSPNWYTRAWQPYVIQFYFQGLVLLISSYMTFLALWLSLLARFEESPNGFFTLSSRVLVPLGILGFVIYTGGGVFIESIPSQVFVTVTNGFLASVIIFVAVGVYRTASEVNTSLKAHSRPGDGLRVVERLTKLAQRVATTGIVGLVSLILLSPAITNGSFAESLTCELGFLLWKLLQAFALFALAWALRGFSEKTPTTSPSTTPATATPPPEAVKSSVNEPEESDDLGTESVLPGQAQ